MPARVGEMENGMYSVEHAVDSETAMEGQVFMESTGFGPLTFTVRDRAAAVVSAINAELGVTDGQKSIVSDIENRLG